MIKRIVGFMLLLAVVANIGVAEETGVANTITDEMVYKPIKGMSDSQRDALKNAKMKVVANPPADSFRVLDRVRMENPPRIGMCMKGTISQFTPWGGSGLQNLWNAASSFEPYVFVMNWTLKGASGSTGDYLEMKGGKPGVSYYGAYPEGFWDGAELYLFRREGKEMTEIHRTTVKEFEILEDGAKVPYGYGYLDGRIHYTDKGPAAQDDDILLMRMTRTEFPDVPKTDINGKPFAKWDNLGHLVLDAGVQRSLDADTFAPENGSTASMKLALPGGESPLGVKHQHFAILENWFGDFDRDKAYRMDVWLKQDGLSGPVTIQIGTFVTKDVEVGSEWEKISIDIPLSELKPFNGEAHFLKIGSKTPGTLWVDNWIISQTDTPPFEILPKYVAELKALKPSIIRWQNGGMNTAPTLEAWLNSGFRENAIVTRSKIGNSIGVGLPEYLTFCENVGADTWLNLPVYTKDDCLNLMEFLCGPADSPYGKKRVERGRVEPWSDAFDQIVIEVANEAWNGMFAPLAWWPPEQYAALASMTYASLKSSPYYEANKDKFIMCAGGWSSLPGKVVGGKAKDWTGVMMQDCENADMVAYADYIGGWDGITLSADTPEELYQSQLLYPLSIIDGLMKRGVACREAVGRVPGVDENPIRFGVYEFGPGYALPSPSQPFIEEAELLGKSLALGVATLDTAMVYLDNGHTAPICFFKFGGGNNFNTHSDKKLQKPIPGYLALKMRNLYCKGDLLDVETKAVKTAIYPERMTYKRNRQDKYKEKVASETGNLPMTGCYAFKDPDTGAISVMVLNRNVDEARKTTIALPKDVQPAAKLYKLTGRPWDTNRDEINVKIEEESISDFSKNYTFEMPASSVYIFVTEPL